MAVKTYHLIQLEKDGVFFQDKSTGTWHTGFNDEEDLTPYLCRAGMFEH